MVEISPFLAALKQDGQQDHLTTVLETYVTHVHSFFKISWVGFGFLPVVSFYISCAVLHLFH